MPHHKNRDDFSEEIKNKAGARVCFQCSICFKPTKAASAEGDDKVSNIGVASHICAAAPKGPRYDPSMTAEERSSIKNCIWLCQDHSKLIDTDTTTYTKEKLIAYKEKAEERVRNAIEGSGEFSHKVVSGGLDVEHTFNLLNDLIINGDYLKLKTYIQSTSPTNMSDEFIDLFTYFNIVYKFYCDRVGIENEIIHYVEKANKKYVNYLVELFAQFLDKELLNLVYDYCEDAKLKKICSWIISDALEGNVLLRENEIIDDQKVVDIEQGSFIHKMATNYAIDNNCTIKDKINTIPFYDGEFLYQQKVLIYKIQQESIKLLNVKRQKLRDIPESEQFLNSLSKIKQLTPQLQMSFWRVMLNLSNGLEDAEFFETLYEECSEQVKNDPIVKSLTIVHKIEKDITSVEFSEIRQTCEVLNDYRLACGYLNDLSENYPQKALMIFNSNLYLFNNNCNFLDIYIRLKNKRPTKSFSSVNFLLKYNDRYDKDSSYHILLAYYSAKSKKHKAVFKRELQWILSRNDILNKIDPGTLSYLISVLCRAEKYDELIKIINLNPLVSFKLQIATALMNSNNKEFIVKAKEIFLDVLKENNQIENVNWSISVCSYKLGDMSNAKKYIQEELNVKFSKEYLASLLNLRIETSDYEEDEILEMASKINDGNILSLVGYIYSRANNKIEVAKRLLLKSLLIDENNLNSLNIYMNLCVGKENKNKPQKAEANVTVILKMEDNVKKISIHNDELLAGLKPNNLANCYHYKESEKEIENILFRTIGDVVTFRNQDYKIIDLVWNETIIFSYAISKLINNNKAVAIKGENIEGLKQNVIEILKDRKEKIDNIVQVYNDSKCNLPITMFSQYLGKKYLETYNFLFYENKRKLRNLDSSIKIKDLEGYVLSFDAILILAILDVDVNLIKNKNCICSVMTKRILLQEIEESLATCKSGSCVGQLIYREGQVYRDEYDQELRRNRILFYNRLKRLVDELPAPNHEFLYKTTSDIENLFLEQKLILENDILGLVQSNKNYVLVNDDPFISSIIVKDKLNAVGMINFLTQLDIDVELHMEYIKKLARMNFGNYLTNDVYLSIKNKINQEKGPQRIKSLTNFYNLLTSEFIDKEKEHDLWLYNNMITKNLALNNNTLKSEDEDDLDFVVTRAVVYNYSRENPQKYKETMDDITKRFRAELVEKDNKLYLKTYLVKQDKKPTE